MRAQQQKEASAAGALSLYSLLETIEQGTMPALTADRQFLERQSSESVENKVPYISFQLAGVQMMIPQEFVAEVGHLPVVTTLPHLPAWIRGVVQLQGEIFPVINLPELFQIHRGLLLSVARSFLLFNMDDFKVCMEVEKISGISNFQVQQEDLTPLTQEEKEFFGDFAVFFKGSVETGQTSIYLLNFTGIKNIPFLNRWEGGNQP